MLRRLALCACFVFLTFSALAKEVVIDHEGLDVLGNLEIAKGKSLERDGAVLLLHGTQAHHRMELIASLQELLRERGVNSLAITLSLGLDQRRGMFDCAIEQDHRHADALEELESWIGWLKTQGAKDITLAGHSRGGNQVALFAARKAGEIIKRVILIAPMTETAQSMAESYERRFGRPLGDVLAQAEKLQTEGEGNTLLEGVPFLNCPSARVTANAFVDYYSTNREFYTPALLRNIKIPVLLVVGGQDPLAAEITKGMDELGETPNVHFETIAGAGHFFRDLYAEDLADVIAKFLKEK